MMANTEAKTPAKPKQVRKHPDERSAEIIEAAANLFLRDGFTQFTMRNVAAAVGIRLGSLQHHFRSREVLLAATLTYVMSGWSIPIVEAAKRQDLSVVERLKEILRINLRLMIDEPAAPVLFELFALTQHDDYAMQVAHEAYLQFRRTFADLLSEANAKLSDEQLMAHATLIVAQTEGLTLFVRPDDPARIPVEVMQQSLDIFAEAIVAAVGAQQPPA